MTTLSEEWAALRAMAEAPDLGSRDAELLEARLLALDSRLREATWEPYPWQVAPDAVPTLGTWLLLGGRGTGKTEGGAHYLNRHMLGPPCDPRIKGGHRAAIVAPTVGDGAESCITGPSGLQAVNPAVKMKGGVGGVKVLWPTGATASLFGAYTAEDQNRLRAGGNRCIVWMEEAAAMRYLDAAVEHTSLGLRIGRNPHYVTTTTPKPRAGIKALLADPHTIITRGRTADAHRLDPSVRQRYF